MAKASSNHYAIELRITPFKKPETHPFTYDVLLSDRRFNTFEQEVVSLAMDDLPLDGCGLNAGRFLNQFWSGLGTCSKNEGLAFGRLLHSRLFSGRLKNAWDEITQKRQAEDLPLRVELALPEEDARVAEFPFELLAQDDFIFRRYGNLLIRTLSGHKGRRVRLTPKDRVGLVWANPEGSDGTLPGTIFDAHEQVLSNLCNSQGMTFVNPCRRVTKDSFFNYCSAHRPLSILSLVAHGIDAGGALVMHSGDHLDAGDLAGALKQAGVDVAFLWSCFGGRSHPLDGSLVRAMLHPDCGNVAVVIGSHAAMVAKHTPEIARAIFDALQYSDGDLERALAEARIKTLPRDDLQWATPAYYARPLEGQSASFERRMEDALPSIPGGGGIHTPVLHGAPGQSPHFQGRGDDVARGLDLLRHDRLLSIGGLPGIGKTEVALAIALKAMAPSGPLFQRALWVDLDGILQVETLWIRIALQWGMERCDQEHLLFHQIGNTALLLVLDNAEDLIRPASANLKRFLRNFMRACPQLKILFSTRRWLGDPEGFKERQLTVERLAPPHDRDIFLAHVDVRLSEEEKQSDTVEQIVKLLEGHPRSLALVAGQAGGPFGLSEILHRLRTETSGAIMAKDLLGEDLTHTPANLLRAETLIHTMNLSYEPLLATHPQTALFFCWLGLLPSGLPMDLVQPVFGDAGENALRVLLRENLAETQNRGHRLTLPAPIRWYASRRLSEHDQQARAMMFRQTLAAFERWIHQAHSLLGTPQSRLAVTLGSIEEANLRSLVDYFKLWREENTREEQLPPSARSLASTIRAWTQLSIFGAKATVALTVVTGCLQAIQNLDQEAEANTLKALGDLLVRTDRLKEAEERYGQALKLFCAIDARQGEANTLKALGDLLVRTARLKEAEERYGQALKLFGAIEDRLGEANTLQALGDLLVRTDRLKEAEERYGQALKLFGAIEERLGEANTLQALGDLLVRT
ncbi:MAG: tetratricopeptide repeat protein, partial [Magnetococcales bacterium]|nr:tetratricopeptide repeat protein [Magnetococcales bacterium]